MRKVESDILLCQQKGHFFIVFVILGLVFLSIMADLGLLQFIYDIADAGEGIKMRLTAEPDPDLRAVVAAYQRPVLYQGDLKTISCCCQGRTDARNTGAAYNKIEFSFIDRFFETT